MLVRTARATETDTIADDFLESFRGLTFLPIVHSDAEIRAWLRDEMIPGHDVLVAEADGEITGFAALAGDLLGHLYVRPEQQGRGVGPRYSTS